MKEEYAILKEGRLKVGYGLELPPPPKSTIIIGDNPGIAIGVDKKFNWFQKKMIKWCFGFIVKENKNNE